MLEQIWARPTCEVNGIIGGYTGAGFKTVIPSKASAKVSFRLVGDQEPKKIADGVPRLRARAHSGRLQGRVHLPWRQPRRSACRSTVRGCRARARALADEWGKEPALIGGGGSIPVVGDFKRILGMNSLMIGFGLDDDRIHSPNEKYDLASFRGGIRSWARILAALAE